MEARNRGTDLGGVGQHFFFLSLEAFSFFFFFFLAAIPVCTMQAIKKIEEHTAALTHTNALLDEAEALGAALGDNPDKHAQLLKEFKLVLDNLSEVQSLEKHLLTDNDVHMASLHFQQASAPLIARMSALTQNASPKKAPVTSSSSTAPTDRLTASSGPDKSSKKVSLSGWLRKRGKGSLSNSHRRYFILDQSAPTQLRYYETDSLHKQKGYIPLDRMEAVLMNESDTTLFGINTGDRVWSLQADTEHDARIWVKALSKWGESFQRLQLRQHILSKEAAEANAAAASNDISPRHHHSSSSGADNASSNASSGNGKDTDAPIDESLLKMQQEAEKRELARQQDSSRRWKEKQELRFQREAARLKEEAQTRYLTSSESLDLGTPSPAATPTKSPRLTGSISSSSGSQTPSSTPIPSLQHSDTEDSDSSTPIPSIKLDAEHHQHHHHHHDSAQLREKLKEALKTKRERNITLTDLLHQRQLFLSLKAEKLAEITKLEDSDATVVQLRAERDEARLLSKQLSNSITTYQQQLLEQDKLIGLIQGSVKQNEDKASLLQSELEQTRADLENLEPPFATVSLSLSAVAVQRMLVQSEMKNKQQVEDKLDMLSEAYRAHEDLATLTRHAFDERERKLQAQIQAHQAEMDELSRALDTTRHKFQYLRTLLNTDAGYSISEELEDLRHDYFVTIVNGIKLNLIQEGHTLKITSPSSLYTLAKNEGVSQYEWPNWISNHIHSKCIESYPPDKRLLHADDGEQQRFAVASDPHLHHQASNHANRTRNRKRHMNFGASFGGNIGGGGLMMM